MGCPRRLASAYGSAAQWQITISFNCNNASLCGGGGGGTWIWAEFDNDGSADTTVTGCGHSRGRARRFAGADHVNIDAHSWTIAPGSAGPATFFVTSETDTLVGHGTPQVVDSPSENFDTGVPAVPGHYSIAQQLFGFTGPGVTAQMQVVKIPGTVASRPLRVFPGGVHAPPGRMINLSRLRAVQPYVAANTESA